MTTQEWIFLLLSVAGIIWLTPKLLQWCRLKYAEKNFEKKKSDEKLIIALASTYHSTRAGRLPPEKILKYLTEPATLEWADEVRLSLEIRDSINRASELDLPPFLRAQLLLPEPLQAFLVKSGA